MEERDRMGRCLRSRDEMSRSTGLWSSSCSQAERLTKAVRAASGRLSRPPLRFVSRFSSTAPLHAPSQRANVSHSYCLVSLLEVHSCCCMSDDTLTLNYIRCVLFFSTPDRPPSKHRAPPTTFRGELGLIVAIFRATLQDGFRASS
jgi:hypothetical protein